MYIIAFLCFSSHFFCDQIQEYFATKNDIFLRRKTTYMTDVKFNKYHDRQNRIFLKIIYYCQNMMICLEWPYLVQSTFKVRLKYDENKGQEIISGVRVRILLLELVSGFYYWDIIMEIWVRILFWTKRWDSIFVIGVRIF